jgi:hypothetical protein
MIEQVDSAVASALVKELERFGWGNKVEVLFSDGPQPGAQSGPMVILSLRSVTENPTLRTEPFHYQRRPGTKESGRKNTPFYFDLNYVIVAQAASAEQSHMLLSHVLASLLLNPTLPLPPSEPDGEPRQLVLSVARPTGEHAFGHVQVLQSAPQGPSITLVVTAPFQPFLELPVPLVQEGLFAIGHRRGENSIRQPVDLRSVRVSATGVVTDSRTGRPVHGATVSVRADNVTVLTDDSGRFVLLNLASGEHLLEVSAQAYAPYSVKIMSPKPGRVQDLVDTDVSLAALDENGLVIESKGDRAEPVRHLSFAPERAGRLTYPDGRPAAYLPVYCGSASTVTSAEGIYFLAAPADAPLIVEIPGIGRVEIKGAVVSPPSLQGKSTSS